MEDHSRPNIPNGNDSSEASSVSSNKPRRSRIEMSDLGWETILSHIEEEANASRPVCTRFNNIKLLVKELRSLLKEDVGDVKGFEADTLYKVIYDALRKRFGHSGAGKATPEVLAALRTPTKESVTAMVELTKEVALHAAEEIESCMNATGFPITDGDVETFKNVILNAIAAATAPPLEPVAQKT